MTQCCFKQLNTSILLSKLYWQSQIIPQQ